MEEFDKIRIFAEDEIIHGFYKSKKLSNGQTAMIVFEEQIRTTKKIEYSIIFAISNKKKNIIKWLEGKDDCLSDKSTGKCGIEGLIWAKQQIIDFEKFINERLKYYNQDIILYVWWTDNKRRNVYEKALGKIGYKIAFRYCSKCLIKKIR